MKQINKEHHYCFVHHCVANNKTLYRFCLCILHKYVQYHRQYERMNFILENYVKYERINFISDNKDMYIFCHMYSVHVYSHAIS